MRRRGITLTTNLCKQRVIISLQAMPRDEVITNHHTRGSPLSSRRDNGEYLPATLSLPEKSNRRLSAMNDQLVPCERSFSRRRRLYDRLKTVSSARFDDFVDCMVVS